jgi:hypothetical protein
MPNATHQKHKHPSPAPQRPIGAESQATKFKKRMLEWSNPVEFVNNMYGCHPGGKDVDYFAAVFEK